MWAELIDNGLLSNPDAMVNVHDVLNVAQRMMVLLGNVNEIFYRSLDVARFWLLSNHPLCSMGKSPT